MNSYVNFIEKNHIKPIKLDYNEKFKYYLDLENLSNSLTGRADVLFANSFIQESTYLLINAISLFENGYFDCAYYSLRQSLEMSTTMNYLSELSPEERDKKIIEWRTQKDFPMNGQMINFLRNNEDIYFDMFNNMKEFFDILKTTKSKLNKFVHKQGNEYLYITRNNPLNLKNNKNDYLKEFIGYLKICIGGVAVFRLAIDPMPVILMDEEIYARTGDIMTTPFNTEFVKEYIGLNHLENYMKTFIYSSHYNHFMKMEKQNEYVIDIIKNKFIDKNKTKEILKQKHLLDKREYIIVSICDLIEKVTKVYTLGGLFFYFTNTKTVRTKNEWSTRFYTDLSQKEFPINYPFDEAYLSYFNFGEDLDIYLEHNEVLTKIEIDMIESIKKNIIEN